MDVFRFKEPSLVAKPWILSDHEEGKVAEIRLSTLENLKNYHILPIEFLFQKYQDGSPGAILNEESGLNTQLQVSVFLNIMLHIIDQNFLVVLLCPDNLLSAWHYHLTIHGELKVLIIDTETLPENVKENHIVHLVPFSSIKRFEDLIKCNYSVAIIDHLDHIASKRVLRRINSGFNLGLTERNFYEKPDQKLQWTMLNWCDPGCVGKLADFYEVDNENLLNFRDNYRHWWLRLTWDFCETFQKPTEDDIQAYTDAISNWAISQKLTRHERNDVSNRRSKRKTVGKRKGGKKMKETKSEEVEQTHEGNIDEPPNESNSVISNDMVKCTQKLTHKHVEAKAINEAEKSNLKFSSGPTVNSENVHRTNGEINRPEIFEFSSSDSTVTNCSSKSCYTVSASTQDHELFLSLINPNIQSERRKIAVSSEVEDILKEADELLS